MDICIHYFNIYVSLYVCFHLLGGGAALIQFWFAVGQRRVSAEGSGGGSGEGSDGGVHITPAFD